MLFKKFEDWVKTTAKKLFKRIGLSHWEESAKVILLLIITMIPICFAFILVLLGLIFGVMNFITRLQYNKTVSQLEDQ